jgi:hypothetical protein
MPAELGWRAEGAARVGRLSVETRRDWKREERIGRGEWIRTTGLLVPNQALYQAEPRPDEPTV